ncbi:MAG TPA: iron-sulfur cluster assembly scaffold protein [Gemmataceae bacterium]|nr:iron-sulfur cluster assembly scaffold protein [Gemmataceae bacterium]
MALPPVKVHCSVLAEDAIKAAIKNYQDKQTTEPAPREEVGTVACAVG